MLAGQENCQTIYEAFELAADYGPDGEFIHIPKAACADYSADPVTLSYGDALDTADTVSKTYGAAGYESRHRIAVALDNRADFFVHFLALNKLGVGVVPLNMELSDEELSYLVEHSDAALIVALPGYVERLKSITERVSEPVAVIADDLAGLSGAERFREIAPERPVEGGEAALLYTSGTTGTPKGCVLSNAHFLKMGRWYTTMGGLCVVEQCRERLLTPLPLYHANALVCSFMAMVHSGGCVIQLDRFHPTTWWDSVRDSHATIIHYLGVMPAMLLARKTESRENFRGQIKFGFGAGVDPRHQQMFEERHGFPLIEAWAMTETGAGAVIAANEEPRHLGQRCFGRPKEDVEFRIVDETGNNVSTGASGELLVRYAGDDSRRYFFSGYYKDLEATEGAWCDGWFRTGDVVRQGEDGSLFFVDRRKNIIRRSGENIAAVEVEGVLQKHPAVAQCAVAPVPDEIRGEEVTACIVADKGFDASPPLAKELFRACSSELAYFKVPGYISFVETLPMTGSQKIQRSELKQLARETIDTGLAVDLRALKKRRRTAGNE